MPTKISPVHFSTYYEIQFNSEPLLPKLTAFAQQEQHIIHRIISRAAIIVEKIHSTSSRADETTPYCFHRGGCISECILLQMIWCIQPFSSANKHENYTNWDMYQQQTVWLFTYTRLAPFPPGPSPSLHVNATQVYAVLFDCPEVSSTSKKV